ncbi:unnamed protein product [Coregonus sp. 'balchen']|nr:unnamed protein product [Coregonus sp. 'balchen']
MEHSTSLTLLLLLLLLDISQANPLVEDGSGPEILIDNPEAVDFTERILTTNNGSSQFLLEGDLLAPTTRNAMICFSAGCFWSKGPNGKVEVPYTVSSSFTSSDKQIIENALQAFPSKTCIRFVPRRNQVDFISYEPRDGCWSSLGRVGGQQVVSLQRDGCVYFGIVQHETLHALGFQHEQTRSDRDQYVRINWSNIDANSAYNFDKSNTNNLNTPYDYSSVMHYGKTAFSINGMDTISPIPNPNVSIGQRQGLSTTDILRINRLYKC